MCTGSRGKAELSAQSVPATQETATAMARARKDVKNFIGKNR